MRSRMTSGIALASCALLLVLAEVSASTYDDALKDWAYVLATYVDESGRTDFVALSADRDRLDRFVGFIKSSGPSSDPKTYDTDAKVIAYHINAYNALAMHGVVERDIPKDFGSFFKRLGLFKLRRVTVDGGITNLYDYENKVIRPLGEERIHFALNCMVRDCPRLPREPFLADRLDSQLETVTREFFSKERHVRVDREKKEIWLSKILDFYTEDFVPSGRRQDLVGYVNRYLQTPIPEEYRVRFITYDWTINQQP